MPARLTHVHFMLTVVLLVASCGAAAQDAAAVSPEVYDVVFENEYVRVIEMTLEPGQSDRMHSHPPMFVYYIQGSTVRVEKDDGSLVEADLRTGGHFWQEATTHRVTNTGTKKLKTVAFEILGDIPGNLSLTLLPEIVAPKSNTLVFENDQIRVVETRSPAGSPGTRHEHMHMVVYAVIPTELTIVLPDGTQRDIAVPAGGTVWSEPVTHRVINRGSHANHLLHVEIK